MWCWSLLVLGGGVLSLLVGVVALSMRSTSGRDVFFHRALRCCGIDRGHSCWSTPWRGLSGGCCSGWVKGWGGALGLLLEQVAAFGVPFLAVAPVVVTAVFPLVAPTSRWRGRRLHRRRRHAPVGERPRW